MSNQWGIPMFDCMGDTNLCIDIWLCFPFMVGRQFAAYNGQSNEVDWFNVAATCCIPACNTTLLRMWIVKKYNIEEALPMTLLWGLCFAGCAACQMHKELTIRGVWPGGMLLHKEPGDYVLTNKPTEPMA
eukprot:TRINITY_DN20687_c0_g1_i1.p1 TRINITY_DN20687_c0_g1~~TRINITY_DN20687_c0_g1_i1.p1  ORF type:complete len:130 (-),score=29.61 TRINITY_DN20687_c0_g1_i1:12-401(-)